MTADLMPSRDVTLDLYAVLRAANADADQATVALILDNVDHTVILEHAIGFAVGLLRVGLGSPAAVDAYLGALTTDTFSNPTFTD